MKLTAAAATAAIALSLLGVSVANADSRHGRRDNASEQRYSHDWKHGQRDYDHDRRSDRRHDGYRHRSHYRDRSHYRARIHDYRRPYGYHYRHWYRGDRLPAAYYARPYVLYNYRGCGLHAPPRGHHWVRVDRDAILAVIATGVVLDVLHDHFH
jgi:Ni/Co efflux regulator RcnB